MEFIAKLLASAIYIWLWYVLVKYRRQVKWWTGEFYWAEKHLWRGGTYLVIILTGIWFMFYGWIHPFWGLEILFK